MDQVNIGTFLVPFVLGMAVMWGIDRWYYTRNGRAKVKQMEADMRARVDAEREALEKEIAALRRK